MLKTAPAVIAALLLGAHYFRAQSYVLVALALAIVPLAAIPRGAARGVARILLAGGTLVWIGTAWRIARERIETGQGYGRMAVILGVVAAFTAFAAWILPGSRRVTS